VVEQFPTQPMREFVRDGAGARAEFAFYDDNAYHLVK
jgi:hypothetical protein